MKFLFTLFTSIVLLSCSNPSKSELGTALDQAQLSNEKMKSYEFLRGMYSDPYFPKVCVDEVKFLLIDLCGKIEEASPESLEELYKLTHVSTELINDLEDFFDQNGSEIETVAREVIAMDFEYIANAYGFEDADVEELIATREW